MTNSKDLNVTANYHAINWTPLRAIGLKNFYDNAPLEMQCQSGSGTFQINKRGAASIVMRSLTAHVQ